MDRIEKVPPIEPIPPIRKIRMRRFKRGRRELMYQFRRLHKDKAKKRWLKKNGQEAKDFHTDIRTSQEQEQDFLDYKTDLKKRLFFDRSIILHDL